MASWGRIARRSFLVGSVAVAGGVAFGVWAVRRPVRNPLAPPDGVALNPFLILDRSGVTVVPGRAEMGQGAQTTLAALVAEELDLDWAEVRVLHGPADAAYANTALLEAGLPMPDYSLAGWRLTLAEAIGAASKLMGLQITGGSTSIRDGYERLRLAGASAREALKQAAAERLGTPPDRLRTEAGAVVAPDGTRLPYADLAEAAARIPAPQVTLRPPSAWKLLGRSLPRPDSRAKVTGAATFGVDIRLPGMKFASPRMCPRLGGTMLRFDPAPALAIPGVERVIDLGDGVAVVARNSWAAMQGAGAVAVEWGRAPYPPTTEAIFSRIEAAFDGRRNSRLRNDGDVERALGTAAQVLEAEYRLPFLAHSTMEPMNATALYTGDRLELWAGNQTPRVQAQRAGAALGLSEAQVTVHTPIMGGGFGRRFPDMVEIIDQVAVVAKQVPYPVKLVWSREEEVRHGTYRPQSSARLKASLKDGQITAMRMDYAQSGNAEGEVPFIYNLPATSRRHFAYQSNQIDGPWRSVNATQIGFYTESFMDELALAAGADPYEFRRKHLPEGSRHLKVLDEVAKRAGWGTPLPEGVGRGIAIVESFDTIAAEVVEVALKEDGSPKVLRAFAVVDCGTTINPLNAEAQIAGGLIMGLSSAMGEAVTLDKGAVVESNFADYPILKLADAPPAVDVHFIDSGAKTGGIGEPGLPPASPALANALASLTGKRIRNLPVLTQAKA